MLTDRDITRPAEGPATEPVNPDDTFVLAKVTLSTGLDYHISTAHLPFGDPVIERSLNDEEHPGVVVREWDVWQTTDGLRYTANVYVDPTYPHVTEYPLNGRAA